MLSTANVQLTRVANPNQGTTISGGGIVILSLADRA